MSTYQLYGDHGRNINLLEEKSRILYESLCDKYFKNICMYIKIYRYKIKGSINDIKTLVDFLLCIPKFKVTFAWNLQRVQ